MNGFFRLWNGSTKGSLGRVHVVDDEMEVKRKMRVQGAARPLVLQLRFPKAVDDQADPKYAFQRKLRPMGSLTCKIIFVKSMLPLFGQLRLGYGFQSRSTHRKLNSPTNSPCRIGLHDKSSMFPL